MAWEWNTTEKQKTNNPDRVPRRSKSTGVKHVRRTISGYPHERASKSEIMGARMNLHSCSPESFGGGNGDSLSPGEISASQNMNLHPPISAIRLWCDLGQPYTEFAVRTAKDASKALSDYKHTNDETALQELRLLLLDMFVTQAVRGGWSQQPRKRGVLTNCVHVVIDDVCCPRKYCALTERAWSRLIDLDNHQQWTRTWKARYQELRRVVQDMDIAGDEALSRA